MSSQSSNPLPPETSCISSSPSKSSALQLRAAHFDEAAVAALATSNPKKRAGRRIFKETRHPIFRGVRMRNNNKWVCELREPSNKKSRIWLGTYPTPEMAARAHDVAALAFKGKSACLNFADSSWRLPLPVSKEAKDIRRAAREGAELFRPREFGGVAQVEETGKSVDSGGKNNFQGNGEFMDEESAFDMPGMNIANMAVGPLLSPPRYTMDDSFWSYKEDIESDVDVSLWSYSI